MKRFTPRPDARPRVLATDLDGTLIPLPDNEENKADLELIRNERARLAFSLVYATGRHLESVCSAMERYALPAPDWVVCDVGTSIHRVERGLFSPFHPFTEHLVDRTAHFVRGEVEGILGNINGLYLQPPANQGRFKISFESTPADLLRLVRHVNERLTEARLPFCCLGSVDPFRDRGLLDVLPEGISKAYALIWLSTHADFSPDEVIYAGDSGNDLDALTSGFRAVLVANGAEGLATEVADTLAERGLSDRFFHAPRKATSGVVDGCRYFGLFT